MAISRMQQPRQMYGLGSFVKKLTRKVTRPITKIAKKFVPKEIAGIMRVAAPFLPPQFRTAAYLLGTARQTGRISPVDLALIAAPKFFSKTKVGQGIADRVGNLTLPGMDRNLREVMVGTPEITSRGPKILDGSPIRSPVQSDLITRETLTGFGDPRTVEATSGIFGKGGEMFQLGKGTLPGTGQAQNFGIMDTGAGQTLFGQSKDPTKISKAKVAGFGTGVFSLITAAKTPEEAGNALVEQTGDPSAYEEGVKLFSTLKPGIFDIPEAYRLNSANGGLMRTNYAVGSDDEGEPIRPDPTKPINPFGPKPTGPVLPDKKMASDDMNERLLEKLYEDLLEEGFSPEEAAKRARKLFNEMSKVEDKEGIMMAGGFNDKYMSPEYAEEFKKFMMKDQEQNKELMLDDLMERFKQNMRRKDPILEAKDGGRANFALGTNPTPEESGLGGLPIEADMRYTGGFMPYGAVEKADDVPARLSKNEFVFTADAVRAAGGGSVNEGAKKMYQAMKQLEKKPEAKGMMA